MNKLFNRIIYIMGILSIVFGFLVMLLDNTTGAIFVGIGVIIVIFTRRRLKQSQNQNKQ